MMKIPKPKKNCRLGEVPYSFKWSTWTSRDFIARTKHIHVERVAPWTNELLGFDSTIPTLSWWIFEDFLEIFILKIGEDEAILMIIFSNGLKAETTKYCFLAFLPCKISGFVDC